MTGPWPALLEHAPDGIVVHDGTHVLAVNAAMLPLTGAHHRDDVIGMRIEALLEHPYLLAVEQQLLARHSSSDPTRVVVDRLHRLDGAVRDVEVRTRLFLADGLPRAQVILRDITERLADERERVVRADREHSVHRREEIRVLAGGVAHQLNNTLQVILGFAGVLAEELPTSQQEEVTEIIAAASRGAKITRQLLEFARLAPNVPETVDLGAAVRRIVESMPFARAIGAPRITLTVEDCGPVWIDPGNLRRILEQMADNAERASDERGDVHITVRGTVSSGDHPTHGGQPLPAGPYAMISVHDSGCGMSPEVQRRLFQPFFTTSAVGGGAGLGLSAVEGLVAQNGGTLLVDSAPGGGSTFTLLLPIAASNAQTPAR